MLARAGENLRPQSVVARGKQGFGGPVKHWMKRPDIISRFKHVTRNGGALADQLREFCQQRLRREQDPHVVRCVDELPRTLNGKVQRFALREAIAHSPPTESATAKAEAPRTL